MLLISAIFLVTQLPHMEAKCQPGEYETSETGCCPLCAPGNRVYKICTDFSSTTCVPCVEDTYTEHPNGLTECKRCKVCDEGARLTIKEKCTYTKNTVCGCASGDFCIIPANGGCEMCKQYSVCHPGSMVKVLGTDVFDNECEKCPKGTFSSTNMSFTCQPWTNCKERGLGEQKAGTSTSDAVCEQASPLLSLWIMAPIIIVLLAGGIMYFSWKRQKRKNGMRPMVLDQPRNLWKQEPVFYRAKFKMPSFKPCLGCCKAFPLDDPHDNYFACLAAQETGDENKTRRENTALAAENGTTANTSVQESAQQTPVEESKPFLSP